MLNISEKGGKYRNLSLESNESERAGFSYFKSYKSYFANSQLLV